MSVVLVREVHLVDQLLRQRRGALERVALPEQVLDAGAQDALVVERAVLIEAPVLDRDRGLLEALRDLRRRHVGRDRVGVDVAEQASVRGVDRRGRIGVTRVTARSDWEPNLPSRPPSQPRAGPRSPPRRRSGSRSSGAPCPAGCPRLWLAAALSFASAHGGDTARVTGAQGPSRHRKRRLSVARTLFRASTSRLLPPAAVMAATMHRRRFRRGRSRVDGPDASSAAPPGRRMPDSAAPWPGAGCQTRLLHARHRCPAGRHPARRPRHPGRARAARAAAPGRAVAAIRARGQRGGGRPGDRGRDRLLPCSSR